MPATNARGGQATAVRKSPEAFRTISEVAEILEIPAHVLRFWESRFSQIKPVKRGGGRRYYRPGDIDLLRGIRDLLYDDGLTIKGVQKVLREQGVKHVAGLGHVDLADLIKDPDAKAPARPALRLVLRDDPPAPEQIDLFAHAERQQRRPFPPDPEHAARVAQIRGLMTRFSSLRDRMIASPL